MAECTHGSALWDLDGTHEAGWRCDDCGAKLGYRPDLDRACIDEKVNAVLFWLSHHGLIYVSNGTEGEIIADNVARACEKIERFDQYTVVAQIMADPNLAGHTEYWAERARGSAGERVE